MQGLVNTDDLMMDDVVNELVNNANKAVEKNSEFGGNLHRSVNSNVSLMSDIMNDMANSQRKLRAKNNDTEDDGDDADDENDDQKDKEEKKNEAFGANLMNLSSANDLLMEDVVNDMDEYDDDEDDDVLHEVALTPDVVGGMHLDLKINIDDDYR